jgi:hypothetical protein
MEVYGKYYSWTSVAIIVAIILVIAYYLGNRTGKGKAVSADTEALKKEIQKSELSYDQTTYEALADKLETAMYGYTDDEAAVYAVFAKLRNKSDLLQLITSFGERRIIFTWGNSNLNKWINNRLDASEIAKVNDILARNNITYNF